jgi:UDP-N-acetylmuramate: L-alanyl-gamma-D-glutamyl-meso-diaminopimelate ligase
MNDLPPPGSHIHLIAICGVGMASLAGLLKSQGYLVTGSDQNVYPPMSNYLKEIGIHVLAGYREEHLSPRPDLVIIGNAVSRNNPEAELVLNLRIPYISFPEALGRFLIGTRQSLVVAGTHGKTTTTALAAWVLTRAGLDPGFFVGGVPFNFASGWNTGNRQHVVIEGDEYDSAFFDKGPKFLHYRPWNVILTSIEFDHADIYRDLDHLKTAFRKLLESIQSDGCVVACSDYPAVIDVVSTTRRRVVYYGDDASAHWRAENLRISEGKSFFDPCYLGKSEGAIEVALIGRHNVKNALAVYAMSREMGIERKDLLEGFTTFAGIKRRQELKGSVRGVLVMDDFAHHPTAVKETIDAVKAAYPTHRVWAIFEPRSNTSRRNIFEHEFSETLAHADRIVLSALHQPEKVPADQRLSVQNVVTAINQACGDGRATVIDKSDDIANYVAKHAAPGDIIIVMSNGAFDGVQEKILQALAAG